MRLSFVTYNIWNTERWDKRAPALRKFLETFDPDLLCLQELRPESRQLIDETLASHQRVDDTFLGWTTESNIYSRKSLFEAMEHGAEDVGILEPGQRRLFWTRLKLRASGQTVLVATAHLTHQRHEKEAATGMSPRVGEMRRIIAALERLNRPGEPAFFAGDLNDPVHPPHLLHAAGYASCFASLGLQPPPTFKCYPTAGVQPGEPVSNQCIDWIVANSQARAIAAAVPHFYYEDAAPSDHWPVQAVYEIREA